MSNYIFAETVKDAFVKELTIIFQEEGYTIRKEAIPTGDTSITYPVFIVLQPRVVKRENRPRHYFNEYMMHIKCIPVADPNLMPANLFRILDSISHKLRAELNTITINGFPQYLDNVDIQIVANELNYRCTTTLQLKQEDLTEIPKVGKLTMNMTIDKTNIFIETKGG